MLVGLLSLAIFGFALCKPDPHSANPSHSKFHPARSSSFQLIKLGNVNITFLDDSNLLGYDGSDFVRLGGYRVKTRFGLITDYNSAGAAKFTSKSSKLLRFRTVKLMRLQNSTTWTASLASAGAATS
jgi:hypothetical protein